MKNIFIKFVCFICSIHQRWVFKHINPGLNLTPKILYTHIFEVKHIDKTADEVL